MNLEDVGQEALLHRTILSARDLYGDYQKYRRRADLVTGVPALGTVIGMKKDLVITIRFLPRTGECIHGFLQRFEKSARILINKEGITDCMGRYVAIKELAHLFLDTESDFTTNPEELIDGLLSIAGLGECKCVDSEILAESAAIELMLPWVMRSHIDTMVQRGYTHYQIANAFKVPEKVVDFYLGNKYQDVLARVPR